MFSKICVMSIFTYTMLAHLKSIPDTTNKNVFLLEMLTNVIFFIKVLQTLLTLGSGQERSW